MDAGRSAQNIDITTQQNEYGVSWVTKGWKASNRERHPEGSQRICSLIPWPFVGGEVDWK